MRSTAKKNPPAIAEKHENLPHSGRRVKTHIAQAKYLRRNLCSRCLDLWIKSTIILLKARGLGIAHLEDFMDRCQVESCNNPVQKPGHFLCKEHWEGFQNGTVTQCKKCGRYKENTYPLCLACYREEKVHEEHIQESGKILTSKAIGAEFDLSARNVNLILSDLGWIQEALKGWEITPQGKRMHAQQKEWSKTGALYVVWPTGILKNRELIRAIKEYTADEDEYIHFDDEDDEPVKKDASAELQFRNKFPATYRATDGHMVRSRAELLIDNWLYINDIMHAYEKKVPIEEDLYSDFYLKKGKVYIEYWGREGDPSYDRRKDIKISLYQKNGLNLIELSDEDISVLDDCLPKRLLKYRYKID